MGPNQDGELQQRLRTWAALTMPQREKQLPELAAYITDKTVTPAVIEGLVEDRSGMFEEASIDVINTPFEVDGQEIKPWTGGFTIVDINAGGSVVDAFAHPKGRVYDEYGSNLYPYALKKAVFASHLDRSSRKGGLDNEANWKHMASLGFKPGKTLFVGDAVAKTRFARLYIGASGCELTHDYIDSILPANMNGNYTLEFVAGYADTVFARRVADQIEGKKISKEEPQFFQALRRSH